ncbi:MAG TPA: uracil-DNA glycosylase family protein, partial [Thermoanaerobaculia bacterium]|nr:uracil-DNA glycosylase family protein [Thermoanaerobaculia bacterium]
ACRPWLEAELVLLRPEGIVCLGATAARALLGAKFRITRDRGTFFPSPWGSPGGSWLTATLHPAAILRIPDPGEREAALAQLIADFQQVQRKLVGGSALVGPGNLR